LNIDLPTVSDDDVMELYMYIDCAVSQIGEPESKNLRQLFDFIRQKRREIEEDRWRANPENWGACCPWPDDDFPF
jgi:negative regulator of replication initiation